MSWDPRDAEPDHPLCERCGGKGYISRYRQTGNPMAADPCGCGDDEDENDAAFDPSLAED